MALKPPTRTNRISWPRTSLRVPSVVFSSITNTSSRKRERPTLGMCPGAPLQRRRDGGARGTRVTEGPVGRCGVLRCGVMTLEGRVALVAGATRGAGRGTAVALGEAGATVYCTGRSPRQQRSEYDRPETIEETAELVTVAGGEGIAAEVDHLEPAQVRELVARID